MQTYNILLVEDDEVDIITVDRVFAKLRIGNPIFKAKDGLEALELLQNNAISRPMIILLDLDMPRMNGLEFLEVVKKDQTLKSIPVVVLTSSSNDQDITKAYENQVAGYLTKPMGMEEFVKKIATLGKYWTICEL